MTSLAAFDRNKIPLALILAQLAAEKAAAAKTEA